MDGLTSTGSYQLMVTLQDGCPKNSSWAVGGYFCINSSLTLYWMKNKTTNSQEYWALCPPSSALWILRQERGLLAGWLGGPCDMWSVWTNIDTVSSALFGLCLALRQSHCLTTHQVTLRKKCIWKISHHITVLHLMGASHYEDKDIWYWLGRIETTLKIQKRLSR